MEDECFFISHNLASNMRNIAMDEFYNKDPSASNYTKAGIKYALDSLNKGECPSFDMWRNYIENLRSQEWEKLHRVEQEALVIAKTALQKSRNLSEIEAAELMKDECYFISHNLASNMRTEASASELFDVADPLQVKHAKTLIKYTLDYLNKGECPSYRMFMSYVTNQKFLSELNQKTNAINKIYLRALDDAGISIEGIEPETD
jgi:hypothetical protein